MSGTSLISSTLLCVYASSCLCVRAFELQDLIVWNVDLIQSAATKKNMTGSNKQTERWSRHCRDSIQSAYLDCLRLWWQRLSALDRLRSLADQQDTPTSGHQGHVFIQKERGAQEKKVIFDYIAPLLATTWLFSTKIIHWLFIPVRRICHRAESENAFALK